MSRVLILFVFSLTLAACGGGGGNGGGLGQGGAGGGSGAAYQPGVFLDWSTYYARCEAPRPGTGDVQGTALDENNFLRSYSNDTYLWYGEITDQDPGNFSDPLAYFDTLRTNALTRRPSTSSSADPVSASTTVSAVIGPLTSER